MCGGIRQNELKKERESMCRCMCMSEFECVCKCGWVCVRVSGWRVSKGEFDKESMRKKESARERQRK